MTDTVTIRRELLERLYEAVGRGDGMYTDELRELRAALAAPVQGEKCAGTGRVPMGGMGKSFGLTNRCFTCHPVTAEEWPEMAAPVQGEAVGYIIDWPDEPELGHYYSEGPNANARSRPLFTTLPQPSEVGELVEALNFAAMSLAQITSSDGSGHADIALCVLRMAGVPADEREALVEGWKSKAQWRIDAALGKLECKACADTPNSAAT